MPQPGKFPTHVAQRRLSQLCLNAAQAVLPPHGAAVVLGCHLHAVFRILQHLAQTLPQGAGESTVAGSGGIVHIHIPFLAAAVRAAPGQTAEGIVVTGFAYIHW